MKRFTDSMDVDPRISLYEYGYLRNPETGKTLVCVNHNEEHTKENPPIIKVVYIDSDEVYDRLREISQGYFDFIGSDRETELFNFDRNYLTGTISSIEMYDGSLETYI